MLAYSGSCPFCPKIGQTRTASILPAHNNRAKNRSLEPEHSPISSRTNALACLAYSLLYMIAKTTGFYTEFVMKKIMIVLLIAIPALAFIGCDNDDCPLISNPPPQAPQGVFSVTGDDQVMILWNGSYEDVVEYVIGWNDKLLGAYEEVGRVSASPRPSDNIYSFTDSDVDNGTTYFYAVWAVDAAGRASEPSYETVFDTPRPEGEVELFSMFFQATTSGFDLSSGTRVPWDATTADVYIDHDTLFITEGLIVDTVLVFFLNAANLQTDIQDMGYSGSFDEIGWAPDAGWSDLRYYELVPGHTYVIWTSDSHYAKMRVNSISRQTGWASFQWAWQPSLDSLGNRELIGPPQDMNDNPVTIQVGDGQTK